jgi:hypothetical protein
MEIINIILLVLLALGLLLMVVALIIKALLDLAD